MAHPGGRPLKFGTPEELEQKISDYFDSLWEESWVSVQNKDGTLTWVQQFDKNGKPLMRLREQPMITGLAKHLDTSRETLLNYQGRDDFFEIVKKAKDLCEYWAEKSATEGSCNYVLGIFKLKNFGWTDAIQISNTNNNESLTADEINRQLMEQRRKNEKSGKRE